VSEQNVELHRRGIEAFNARDVEAFVGIADPEVEFHSVYEAVGGADYHGHSGTRQFFRDLEDTWDEIRVEPEMYFDLGENTLLYYVGHGRGMQSGAEVAMALAQVCRWRDGLCVYWKTYVTREDALRDLGVSAEALEPIAP
jgi:ketosteroid isomerase-like protein